MRKLRFLFVALFVGVLSFALAGCGDSSKTITVCASDVPHAEVLNGVVKDLLKEKGYTLKVKVIDWTVQNDGVAKGDYDANYFQHVPYLETYTGSVSLFAVCKVHYEPLGIYRGKATGDLASGKTFEICNDSSNAVRAFQLLKAKGVLTNIPVNEDGELTLEGDTYVENDVTVKLVAENLLVAQLADYDFACLPCNTAYTGRVSSDKQVAKEDDPAQVSLKANILAARTEDYKNNEVYKAKIDALADALLSEEVRQFFSTQYLGAMTCDSSSQIDLRK